MDKFVTSIKRKYRERLLQREQQWPPVSVEKLVNLQLVEAEKKEGFRAGLPQHGAPNDKVKCTPILHGDLFKVEEGKKPVRKLIVEGNAGIGKTTLCTMLTEEWANAEILTQFDCVLLLPLRERSVSTATTLPQLFKLLHSSERIRTSVIEELEEREGEGVLIIADGWDELDSENRSDDSFLHGLLFGTILPFAFVLLTSRPAASAPLHDLPNVDRLVEVVGFNEENVKQYIESELEKCPEKASSLIEQLENNPLIASVCSVPLNCAIVCHLWYTLKGVLPRTLTELYAKITLTIILRNHKKYFGESPISLSSFDSIPEDLQDLFWLACKFAFECLSSDRIVFLEDEITSSFSKVVRSNDKFLCFGLLQSARSLLPVGQGLSFHFVHLTIQEFLAALHLVTLPSEEKLKVCETHAVSDRFAMVWRFVFGFAFQKEGSYSRKVVCLDDEVVDRLLGRCVGRKDLNLMLCHCAAESLNDSVGSKIGKHINGKFENFFTSIASTPYDCVAVFHILRHTSHCSDMTISLSNCGLTDKLLKELTDILSSAGGELQVGELSLKANKLTDNGVTDMFERASTSFSSLKSLDLCTNRITNISPLFSSCKGLAYLYLSENPLGVSGIQSLETAVLAGVLVNLRRLDLSNTLTDDADINGALLATLSPSIASHCPLLRLLDLSENNLGVPGASALSRLYTSERRKLDLNFSNANINAEAIVALKPFCYCNLNLNNNPLGCDGLLAIFRILRGESCPITSLQLESADLVTQVNTKSHYHMQLANTSSVLNLGPVLYSSRLTDLYLSRNDFSGSKVFILAECVRVCKSLGHLACWKCSLASSEVISILDHLKNSDSRYKNLWRWDLDDNSIDDKGVNVLIKHVPELFPSLEEVGLRLNLVSGEVKERLEEVLKTNMEEYEESEINRFAVEEEVWKSAVLTEWERTWSPPQSGEMVQTFHEMWAELLEELVYGILDHPIIESVHSLNHWNLVMCEGIPARCDPQRTLELTYSTGPSLVSSNRNSLTITKYSPAAPSDDKSVHSATEELDEPVGPPPTATDESTTVQSPHRMDQQETMSSNGTMDVSTPPQTTPFSCDTFSEVCGLRTVTVDELKTQTKVTDPQLDSQIQERDLLKLSSHFDNVESYLVHLGLTPSQRTDIKDLALRRGTQIAMSEALRLWREPNPYTATYRALVEVLLDLGKGEVAVEVCAYLTSKSSLPQEHSSAAAEKDDQP